MGKLSIPLFFTILSILLHVVQCQNENDIDGEDKSDIHSQTSDIIGYVTPDVGDQYFYESFDDRNKFHLKWIKSIASKSDSSELKYDGEWDIVRTRSLKDDLALITKSKARHHAYGAKLNKIFKFNSNPFIVQYEVQFRNGQECGGAYLKLLHSPSGDLQNLNDRTKYSIMFGPDKCGNENKLHFIFNHKNPRNGTITEKHWIKAGSVTNLDEVFKDGRWHQFRLEIYPDNSFQVSVDNNYAQKGLLLEDFKPPVNPAKMIDDPKDSKPEDWDEREKIPDPDAEKPDDWDEDQPRKIADLSAKKPDNWNEDEPEMVPDPAAKKPDDWDVEMDGEWESPLIPNPKCASIAGCGKWSAPLIDNPKYKGKWKAPLISNPAYKGKWVPKKIPNPDFYEDLNPFKTMAAIDAVAFELWTISDNIAFDNILITDDLEVANYVSSLTYQIKKEMSDEETDNFLVRAMKYANKNPWMWAVYLFAIGIPLVLFIAFCCVSPVKKTADKNDSYDPSYSKKMDISSPDSIPEVESKIDGKKEVVKDRSIGSQDIRAGDENLVEEEVEDDEEEEEEEEEIEEDDDDEEIEETTVSPAVQKQSSSHSSPRQRRPRKE
ncbi:Calnexin [Sarcoptes scabiei]|uniref:Calnexin n=1 Tax=Sarcoptes scabiei TaxID=52283 RepID=A0A834R789_SARSC|nr:Calnexin [Sarcoptes scabiei]